jgi:small-conductance mechanosensitive channel
MTIFDNLEILQKVFFGNSVLSYLYFLGLLLILFLLIEIFESLILSKLKKEQKGDNLKSVLISFIISIKAYFYLYLSLYISLSLLTIPQNFKIWFTRILIIWIAIRVVIGVQMLIDYLLDKKLLTEAEPGAEAPIRNIGTVFKALLWVFAFLLILSNFGVEVTSLIAGLGVGGIAVAFAFQNILEDLFSSFAIYFDKPFVIGDYIVVGEKSGVVETIGIKTTRLRALQGEEIVMANKELTTAKIHNYKKMEKRRAIAIASSTRAKPILLTAIAIILGSALLASDPVFGGLGVALISGTIAAVIVSLVFIPILMDNSKAI